MHTTEGHPEKPQTPSNIDTGGGLVNAGNINTQGGDLAGRDIIHNHFYNIKENSKTNKLFFEPETCLISAGKFIMGSNELDDSESPQTYIDLPDFRIGKYPITNAEYAYFISKTERVAPKELLWDGNTPFEKELRNPVVGVTWLDAMAYCEWLNDKTGRHYSLPNEAQWEKAARGTEGYTFPWGNEWEPDRCNDDLQSLRSVDHFPSQSVYGCFDMVGNAREWTVSLWGPDRQSPDSRFRYPWKDDYRNNLDAPITTRRIYRGGFGTIEIDYRCSRRGSFLPDKRGPRRNRHGFRIIEIVDR